ncbi:MAG: hypothetical protein ABIQ05_04455 [Candidatus Limnocylindria bacterium]
MGGDAADGSSHIAGDPRSGGLDRAQRRREAVTLRHGNNIADPEDACSSSHRIVDAEPATLVQKGLRQPFGAAPKGRDDGNQIGLNHAPTEFNGSLADPLHATSGDQLRSPLFEERPDPSRGFITEAAPHCVVAVDSGDSHAGTAGGDPGGVFQPWSGPLPAKNDRYVRDPGCHAGGELGGIVEVAREGCVFTSAGDPSTVSYGPCRHDQLVVFDLGTRVQKHVTLLEVDGRGAACDDIGSLRCEQAGERDDRRLGITGRDADEPRPVDDLGLAADYRDWNTVVLFPQGQGDFEGSESAPDDDDALHASTPATTRRRSPIGSPPSAATAG